MQQQQPPRQPAVVNDPQRRGTQQPPKVHDPQKLVRMERQYLLELFIHARMLEKSATAFGTSALEQLEATYREQVATIAAREGPEQHRQKALFVETRRTLGIVRKNMNFFYEHNKKFFIKEARRRLRELHRFRDWLSPTHRKTYEDSMASIASTTGRYYADLSTRVSSINTAYMAYSSRLNEEQRDTVTKVFQSITTDATKDQIKLRGFYNFQYDWKDIVLDKQFWVIYGTKVLRIGLTYAAINSAIKMFSTYYSERVYQNNKSPPSLTVFVGMVIAFDAAFNAVFLAGCLLLKYLFKRSSNDFFIDEFFFKKYLIDYVVSTALFALAGSLVGSVMANKKYFRWKYEGLKAVRAFGTIMTDISIITAMIPSFLLL